MANEVVGFGTSLFGFSKKDVLSCIERLSAESQKAEQDARARMESLQAELDNTRTENTSLKTKTEEKAAIVTQLMEQLNGSRRNAEETNEQIAKLKDREQDLETKNQDYRRRLFQSEETVIRLQRQNSQLQQDCDEKQARLDKQNSQMAELKQACESRLREIGMENDSRVEKAEQEAEQKLKELRLQLSLAQAEPEREKLRAGADKVNYSLTEVKKDLTAVGDKINLLNHELQTSIWVLQNALDEAARQTESFRTTIVPSQPAEPIAFQKPVETAAPVVQPVPMDELQPGIVEQPAAAVPETPIQAAAVPVEPVATASPVAAAEPVVPATPVEAIPEWQLEFQRAARAMEPDLMSEATNDYTSGSSIPPHNETTPYAPGTEGYVASPNMAERLLDSLSKMLNQ